MNIKKIIKINSFASLINIICLFAILFVISSLTGRDFYNFSGNLNNKISSEKDTDVVLPNDSVDHLDVKLDASENNAVSEDVVKRELLMNFNPGNIFFETNSYELNIESANELRVLAHFFSRSRYSKYKLIIEGHTDNIGDADYNLRLSMQRAKAIYDFLLNEGNIDKRRLEFVGYGETKYIADNSTESGRSKNRRVEFKVNKLE